MTPPFVEWQSKRVPLPGGSMRRHPPRCLAGFPWNHWPGSRGIRGRNQMESPAGITWNAWPGSSGICTAGSRVRLRPQSDAIRCLFTMFPPGKNAEIQEAETVPASGAGPGQVIGQRQPVRSALTRKRATRFHCRAIVPARASGLYRVRAKLQPDRMVRRAAAGQEGPARRAPRGSFPPDRAARRVY